MADETTLSPIEALGARVAELLGERIVDQTIAFGELTVRVHRETILDCLRKLHDDDACRFISFVDIAGAD